MACWLDLCSDPSFTTGLVYHHVTYESLHSRCLDINHANFFKCLSHRILKTKVALSIVAIK